MRVLTWALVLSLSLLAGWGIDQTTSPRLLAQGGPDCDDCTATALSGGLASVPIGAGAPCTGTITAASADGKCIDQNGDCVPNEPCLFAFGLTCANGTCCTSRFGVLGPLPTQWILLPCGETTDVYPTPCGSASGPNAQTFRFQMANLCDPDPKNWVVGFPVDFIVTCDFCPQ